MTATKVMCLVIVQNDAGDYSWNLVAVYDMRVVFGPNDWRAATLQSQNYILKYEEDIAHDQQLTQATRLYIECCLLHYLTYILLRKPWNNVWRALENLEIVHTTGLFACSGLMS